MAVTINQVPANYTPAFNPQIFEATSTAIGNSDFYYKVVCTDQITGATQTYQVKQRPTTGELVFDASVFSKNYIDHYVPNNVYGWQKCTNAVRRIIVNIGEYYGGTYYPGANRQYIIWNSAQRGIDWPSYSYTNYVFNGAGSNVKFLSSLPPESASYKVGESYTYTDASLFHYALSYGNGDVGLVKIITYTKYDTVIGTSYIANPYSSGYTYTDKYVCIDIGSKGLTNIGSLSVTGTYPILSANTAYYEVYDNSNLGSPSASTDTLVRRVYLNCEGKYTVYTLHYLARNGNFETINFSKRSDHLESAQKNSYRPNPNVLASNNYSYSASAKFERVLSSTGTETYKLNSDWISENQMNAHREIVTSPLVYMDLGSTTGLVQVKVNNADILINKSFNNKLFALQIDVEQTAKNNYQFG